MADEGIYPVGRQDVPEILRQWSVDCPPDHSLRGYTRVKDYIRKWRQGRDRGDAAKAFVPLQDAQDQGIDVKAGPASQSRSLVHALASLPT